MKTLKDKASHLDVMLDQIDSMLCNENYDAEDIRDEIKIIREFVATQFPSEPSVVKQPEITEEEIANILIKDFTGSSLSADFRNTAIYGAKRIFQLFPSYFASLVKQESEISRVEVIDHSKEGRAYVNMKAKDVELLFQDNNRTLKIFLKTSTPTSDKKGESNE